MDTSICIHCLRLWDDDFAVLLGFNGLLLIYEKPIDFPSICLAVTLLLVYPLISFPLSAFRFSNIRVTVSR